jgi:hypothetical protein
VQWNDPRFAFPKAEQFAFLFENAHLLMLSWERDNAKFLFLIKEHQENGLVLDYPGETFTNRVLDTLENIFFVQVEEEGEHPKRYVLGSFFAVGKANYGAYYERGVENPNVVLFRIDGEAPDFQLEVLEEDEYERIAPIFAQQHGDVVEIEQSNRQSGGAG